MPDAYPAHIKEEAIILYKSGLSSRKVAKRLGINQKTVLNWAWSVGFHREQGEAQSGASNPNYGKRLPEETRRKISEAQKGRPLTVEHRQKLSEAKKGKPVHPGLNPASVRATRGKPLSAEHRRKISEANRGEKSSNWKGGVTPEHERSRKSVEFKLWREAVFARDNWTCQSCNRRGGRLEPHHIKPFAYYPKLRFAIDNGITYCVQCHKQHDIWRH